jgi:hypothetical protein
MSMPGIDLVMSALMSRWLPYQPASMRTYSRPNSAAKSMKCSKVASFIPTSKSAPGTAGPFHQSQDTRPGRIHEVSSMRLGSERLQRIVDSARAPGRSATMSTRQGDRRGVCPMTLVPG